MVIDGRHGGLNMSHCQPIVQGSLNVPPKVFVFTWDAFCLSGVQDQSSQWPTGGTDIQGYDPGGSDAMSTQGLFFTISTTGTMPKDGTGTPLSTTQVYTNINVNIKIIS